MTRHRSPEPQRAQDLVPIAVELFDSSPALARIGSTACQVQHLHNIYSGA
jgi:hypothetical protein